MELPKPWNRERRLAGDASCRRYARLWDSRGRTAILARYPRAVQHQLARDLEVRSWCAVHGLRVPALLDYDLEQGWAVHEDLGFDDAERALENAPTGKYEELALLLIGPLINLAKLQTTDLPDWNPPLDAARMRWELAGFELWFLCHRLEVTPSPAVGQWLDELAAVIDTHPRRVCHRDYHLNNLFFLPSGEVGLIDYQDILIGPDTYDAVSLLGERGMPLILSNTERGQLQEAWATASGALPGWKERWRWVAIQRGLKVLGTFARLAVDRAGPYEQWIDTVARRLTPELESIDAPSELVDLLLDSSRRRHPPRGGRSHEAAPA